MKRVYQMAETQDRQAGQEFPVRQGQQLLPCVERSANAPLAVDEFRDVRGRGRRRRADTGTPEASEAETGTPATRLPSRN